MTLSELFLHGGFGRRWEGILGPVSRVLPLGVGAPPRKGNRIKVGGDNTEYMGTCWSSVLH